MYVNNKFDRPRSRTRRPGIDPDRSHQDLHALRGHEAASGRASGRRSGALISVDPGKTLSIHDDSQVKTSRRTASAEIKSSTAGSTPTSLW